MSTAPLSLGIDIGGTFTDLVIHDPRDGRAVIWKESTTPDDPARGAIEGTRRVLAKAGAKPEQVGRVVHATTLFTNALIERKGARTGLLTTAGFRDVLEIGRERKYELYDLFIEMPKPLVARPWRREAKERLAQDGTVEIPSPSASCTPMPTPPTSAPLVLLSPSASRTCRSRCRPTSRPRSANTCAPARR